MRGPRLSWQYTFEAIEKISNLLDRIDSSNGALFRGEIEELRSTVENLSDVVYGYEECEQP